MLPEQLFWSESGSICLVCRSWTTSEGIADREDTKATEGIEGEQDEDGQRHQAVHDLLL